jgi:hypothetical protein
MGVPVAIWRSKPPLPSGTPDESGDVVFIREFIDWEDKPFVVADSGLFRMLPSDDPRLPYKLVLARPAPIADIMSKGSTVSESDAIKLVRTPVELWEKGPRMWRNIIKAGSDKGKPGSDAKRKPFIARFMDGRDAVGTPWEAEGPNSPIFVEEFIDWEGKPFLFATDGCLFRMLPSNDNKFRYTLESIDASPNTASILSFGSEITESEAVSLL